MSPPSGAPPARDTLSHVSLQMTSRLEIEEVLATIVEGLVAEFGLALARIWLVLPDRLCPHCAKEGRLDDAPALHLAASAGIHTRTTGTYHRVPIGTRKIGAMAESRAPILSTDLASDPRIADKAWIEEHGLRSFAGYPLVFQDEVLGVLGTFGHRRLDAAEFEYLGVFANQAAIAIQNARLFSALKRANLLLKAENEYLLEQTQEESGRDFEGMVGSSPAMRALQRQIRQVAPTDSAVLVLGETGTGKEMVARAIHALSPRKDRALVKVNAGAITGTLAESELFGHERGAFTGAHQRRIGRFELADRGTLFLDEIGELPPDIQVKLLRVLQEQEFERVGGDRPIRVDVRIIAATNRDLSEAVATGGFRADLFYRLNVFPIEVPPLRRRPEDVPLLVDHFLRRYSVQFHKPLRALSPESMERLLRYPWPGNIRELQNVIERACIVAAGPIVEVRDPLGDAAPAGTGPLATLEEVEREHVLRVLDATAGVVEGPRGAAGILGINPSTLRSRMQKLGIPRGTGRR